MLLLDQFDFARAVNGQRFRHGSRGSYVAHFGHFGVLVFLCVYHLSCQGHPALHSVDLASTELSPDATAILAMSLQVCSVFGPEFMHAPVNLTADRTLR